MSLEQHIFRWGVGGQLHIMFGVLDMKYLAPMTQKHEVLKKNCQDLEDIFLISRWKWVKERNARFLLSPSLYIFKDLKQILTIKKKKIADLQAHSAPLGGALWACRSAVFEKSWKCGSNLEYIFFQSEHFMFTLKIYVFGPKYMYLAYCLPSDNMLFRGPP